MPTGVRVLERIPPGVEEAVVVGDRVRVRDEGVRAEEGPQLRVIVAGVEVEQAGGVLLPAQGDYTWLTLSGLASLRKSALT